MVDIYDESKNKSGSNEAANDADMPEGGYARHPLFPREDAGPESRDIQFVSFRRRRTDGRADNCPEDIPAHLIHTWAQVTGPWGGGEYKAMGKDSNHRIVAWAPEKPGEWLLFDGPSKPFTVRGEPYAPPQSTGATAAVSATMAPPPAPVLLAPPPSPAANPPDPTMSEVLRELRELRACVASAQVPTPAPAPSTNDAAMVEMIKSQGELVRTVLGAALTPRPVEASAKPNADPMAMALQLIGALRPEPSSKSNADPVATALQLLGAFQKFAPQAQGQGTVTDRLGEYRAIRELATPSAPPAPQSDFGEIKDLFMSVMQADAMSKSTRDVMASPPVPERRPPPPPPQSRAPLQYVPGLGMVRVEQPEAPPLRTDERALDYEALLRDPSQRQRMLQALGLDRPVVPAPAVVAAPPWNAPTGAAPSVPVAVESTPVVSIAATAPAPSLAPDSAFDHRLHVERAPAAPTTPSSPIAPVPAAAVALPSIPVAVEVTPAVSSAAAAVAPSERLDSAFEPRLHAGRAPVAPTTPIEMAPAPVVASEGIPWAPPEPMSAPQPERAPIEAVLPIEVAPPIEVAAADERIPIALPERMPVAEPHVTTEQDRDRATTSLGALLSLPRERLRGALCALPGVGANVEDLMSAMGAIPREDWPTFVSHLPAEMVLAIGDFKA
jgi:hypothetical protein